jgi:hypothetical protein
MSVGAGYCIEPVPFANPHMKILLPSSTTTVPVFADRLKSGPVIPGIAAMRTPGRSSKVIIKNICISFFSINLFIDILLSFLAPLQKLLFNRGKVFITV